jgi:hypothetical protein
VRERERYWDSENLRLGCVVMKKKEGGRLGERERERERERWRERAREVRLDLL